MDMSQSDYFALCALLCVVPSLGYRWRMLLATFYATITIAYKAGYL